MPQGKIHDIITAVATPVVVWGAYHITKEVKTTVIITSLFLFASLMFNGDLDILSSPYNRWWIFKFIWIPYQKIFHHRSIYTHGLILGTIVRILYLSIIPIVILYFQHDLSFIKSINLHMAIIIFIGLELGSALHTIADYTIKS